MSLIGKLQNIIDEARSLYTEAQRSDLGAPKFEPVLQMPGATDNLLVKGDNLSFMRHMMDSGYGGKVNLIYVDPPFFSKANYDASITINSDKVKDIPKIKLYAYHDTWENGMEDYLRMLCIRFLMMRDLLADDGSLWVHLDWHGVHYVKIMLDEIFGQKNFVNEVIWNYKSGGTSKRHFSRKHDTLLFYSKTNRYYFKPQTEKSYNRELKPYRFQGVKEYKDDVGWHTMVNMKDVWQIDMVGRTSAERTGYATQKPEALLERIIESCSKAGDLCVDFFGGSGTLANVCHKLGRKWISCDAGSPAFAGTMKRLRRTGAGFAAVKQVTDSDDDAVNSGVQVEFSMMPMGASGENQLNVKLVSYHVDVKKIALDESAEKAVKNVLKSDSLSLIDYWSVDFDFDGKTHRPERTFFSGKSKIYECEQTGRFFGRISVYIMDVFGNTTIWEDVIT